MFVRLQTQARNSRVRPARLKDGHEAPVGVSATRRETRRYLNHLLLPLQLLKLVAQPLLKVMVIFFSSHSSP